MNENRQAAYVEFVRTELQSKVRESHMLVTLYQRHIDIWSPEGDAYG